MLLEGLPVGGCSMAYIFVGKWSVWYLGGWYVNTWTLLSLSFLKVVRK
jgi:hypothetical protein